MPAVDGLTVLAKLREAAPNAHVIVMTAHGTMETAIHAMQRGAYDYLAKPFDLGEVLLLAERALAAGRLTPGGGAPQDRPAGGVGVRRADRASSVHAAGVRPDPG